MKHTLKVTLILLCLFFFSQILGLLVTSHYITTGEDGQKQWKELPEVGGVAFERPDVDPHYSLWYMLIAILIGTSIVMLIIKYKKIGIWKGWFYVAVVLCLTFALGVFIGGTLAFIASLVLAYYKIYRRNIYVHNLTELFLYAGMAAIFVPLLNVWSMIILLILISIYDFIAVYKSKHMVSMATFQSNAKVFAGLFIPYEKSDKAKMKNDKEGHKKKSSRKKLEKKKTASTNTVSLKKTKAKRKVHHAILGGGDIAFPLFFAGVIMQEYGNFVSFVVPLTATLALAWLLYKSEKGKFYPAMPIISLGCFVGFGIIVMFF